MDKKSIVTKRNETFMRTYQNIINMLTKSEEVKNSDLFANFADFYLSYSSQIKYLKNQEQTNSVKTIIKKYNEKKKRLI
jgi:hypothetical protein